MNVRADNTCIWFTYITTVTHLLCSIHTRKMFLNIQSTNRQMLLQTMVDISYTIYEFCDSAQCVWYGYRMAEQRVREWMEADRFDTVLDLSNLWLCTIPPLPLGVRMLNLSHNRLLYINEALPKSMKWIDCSHNFLWYIPPHPYLHTLICHHNYLTQLKGYPQLEVLQAEDNDAELVMTDEMVGDQTYTYSLIAITY